MEFDAQIENISSWIRSNKSRIEGVRALWNDENGRAFTDVVAEGYFLAAKSMQEKVVDGRQIQQNRIVLEGVFRKRLEESKRVAERMAHDRNVLLDHLHLLDGKSRKLDDVIEKTQQREASLGGRIRDSGRRLEQLSASTSRKSQK